jgi:hypothetical protein
MMSQKTIRRLYLNFTLPRSTDVKFFAGVLPVRHLGVHGAALDIKDIDHRLNSEHE